MATDQGAENEFKYATNTVAGYNSGMYSEDVGMAGKLCSNGTKSFLSLTMRCDGGLTSV